MSSKLTSKFSSQSSSKSRSGGAPKSRSLIFLGKSTLRPLTRLLWARFEGLVLIKLLPAWRVLIAGQRVLGVLLVPFASSMQ